MTGGEIYPDCLEVGDELVIDGAKYVVEEVDRAEALLHRADLPHAQAEVFRWYGGCVGFDLNITVSQEEFAEMVK